MLLQPEYPDQLSISPHQACLQYLIFDPVSLPAPAVHVPDLRLWKNLAIQEEGGFIPQGHRSLKKLASSSAPFRNVISIIYRWEYISGEGRGQNCSLEEEARKWGGESGVCGKEVWEETGQMTNMT